MYFVDMNNWWKFQELYLFIFFVITRTDVDFGSFSYAYKSKTVIIKKINRVDFTKSLQTVKS